jgi:hypothetical protein
MIDSERGRCNANVPFHLPDVLEYKFLGCIPDSHQSRMASNGIGMTVQAGLGWGGGLRTNVYAACSGGVVVVALRDLVAWEFYHVDYSLANTVLSSTTLLALFF